MMAPAKLHARLTIDSAASATQAKLGIDGSLGKVRLALTLFPFRRIAASLGVVGGESPASVPPEHGAIASQVGLAVETIARHIPWDSRCLVQALAAWRMLHRRGIAATIYFGVTSNPDKPFDAHAWLRCGTCFVTGGEPHEQYRVLTNFAQNTAETCEGTDVKQGR